MAFHFFTEETKTSIAISVTNGAAGATAINGATLDMAGWDGVAMIVTMGAIVAGAVTSINAAQGAASNLSDAADLEGTGQTIADDADEKVFIIDLKRPRERYVRLEVARATQNATIASAIYVQYRGRTKGTTQGSNVSAERWSWPAEGEA